MEQQKILYARQTDSEAFLVARSPQVLGSALISGNMHALMSPEAIARAAFDEDMNSPGTFADVTLYRSCITV